MRTLFFGFSVFLFTLLSCHADELEQAMEQDPLFDLERYFAEEAERLEALSPTVTKTILLNGKTETRQIQSLSFSNDFRIFQAANVNKPNWRDKYAIEESSEDGFDVTIYTTQDSSLMTQRVEIHRKKGEVQYIEIDRRTGTVLSRGEQKLFYRPLDGYYRFTNKQTNRFADNVDAEITADW